MPERDTAEEATPRPRQYTLIVVSDASEAVRKYHLDRRSLSRAAVALGVLALLGVGLGAHYASLLRVRSQNRALERENGDLRAQIQSVKDRVGQIAATLDRVERFDAKLRGAQTQLQEPERALAIGPVGKDDGGRPAVGGPAGDAQASSVPAIGTLQTEAARQESTLSSLQSYFEKQGSLLATSPSTWPTRGWVTSDFGERLDPYTAARVMHRGLDIATPTGQPVYAPSDGTVVFAGIENGYGKVLIIDHGYGVRTRYGHLSEFYVKRGDRVRRGARIAAVGNSGRSTGPHLHYEVRVNGIPENPRKFILE